MTHPLDNAGSESNDDRDRRHLAMLAEVGELTLGLIRKTAAEAMAETAPEPKPATSRRSHFERLVKSLRDTIALERRIAGTLAAHERTKTARAAAAKPESSKLPPYLRKPPPDPAAQDDLSLLSRRFHQETDQ